MPFLALSYQTFFTVRKTKENKQPCRFGDGFRWLAEME